MLIQVVELREEEWFVGSADAVQRPKGAELDDNVALLFEQLLQLLFRGVQIATTFCPRGQFEPRLTTKPLIGVRVELHQFGRAQFCDVSNFALFGLAVTDFVDAPAGAMNAG